MQLRTLTAIGCIAVTLAACGGGGSGIGLVPSGETAPGATAPSGTPTASTGVPASAFQSVDAFIAYVRGLASDETSEPLALPNSAAPTSDTTEPTGA